ncbi:MAG: VOC family protein [bacterium]
MFQDFVHVEIPSANLQRAASFYHEVFGWQMNYVEEADYMLFETGGAINGAFYHSPDHTGRQGVVVYIHVGNIEASLKLINENGGKTFVPKTPVEKMGSFALFHDPDGNVLGIWENEPETAS